MRRRQVLGVVVGLVSLLKLSSWHLRARISESNAEVILPWAISKFTHPISFNLYPQQIWLYSEQQDINRSALTEQLDVIDFGIESLDRLFLALLLSGLVEALAAVQVRRWFPRGEVWSIKTVLLTSKFGRKIVRFDVNRQAIAEVVLKDDFETKSHNCQSQVVTLTTFWQVEARAEACLSPEGLTDTPATASTNLGRN